ncbi:MAG: hypothetical protein Q9220_000398 [cf. Caloplaca sp. 1 TL-2023]
MSLRLQKLRLSNREGRKEIQFQDIEIMQALTWLFSNLSLPAGPDLPDPFIWKCPGTSGYNIRFLNWGVQFPLFDDVISVIDMAESDLEKELKVADEVIKNRRDWSFGTAGLNINTRDSEGRMFIKSRMVAWLKGLRTPYPVFLHIRLVFTPISSNDFRPVSRALISTLNDGVHYHGDPSLTAEGVLAQVGDMHMSAQESWGGEFTIPYSVARAAIWGLEGLFDHLGFWEVQANIHVREYVEERPDGYIMVMKDDEDISAPSLSKVDR